MTRHFFGLFKNVNQGVNVLRWHFNQLELRTGQFTSLVLPKNLLIYLELSV